MALAETLSDAALAEFEHKLHFQAALHQFEDPNEERVTPLPAGILNECYQIRHGDNPVQDELRASIKARGQRSPVVVGFLTTELLSDYIDFSNHTWHGDKRLEDCVPLPGYSDLWALLIAGHSRVRSVRQNAQAEGLDPKKAMVRSLVRYFTSIDEIVYEQRDENIHSQPAPERVARAIVEEFLWLQQRDRALTKKAYAEQHNISTGFLNDALHYVSLPPEVRAMTDNGAVPFRIGILLGRAYPHIEAEAVLTFPFNNPGLPDIETRRLREEWIQLDLERFLTRFNEDGRRIGTFKIWLQSQIDGYKAKQPRPQNADDSKREDAFNLTLWEETPAMIKAAKRDQIIKSMARVRGRVMREHVRLHQEVIAFAQNEIKDDKNKVELDLDLMARVQTETSRLIEQPA